MRHVVDRVLRRAGVWRGRAAAGDEGLLRLAPPAGVSDHARGPATAAVTLVQYGDYECRRCASAHPLIEEVRRRCGRDLRFIFRHFPFSRGRPHAVRAAEVAEAAGAQGRFWQMHDYLFTHAEALDDGHLVGYAAELGLDVMRLLRGLTEHAYLARVREDIESGIRSGVESVPAFFINGARHRGAWDVDTLLDEIAAAGDQSPPGAIHLKEVNRNGRSDEAKCDAGNGQEALTASARRGV